MNKLDYLKSKIDELNSEERRELDEHLVNKLSDDAEKNREQFDLILSSDYIEEAKKLRDSWGKMQGLTSGYPSIDKLTKGFVGGEIIVIGGATSTGKTSLTVNIVSKLIHQNVPVLFVTLEMTRAQLTGRTMYLNDNFEDVSALLSYQKSDEFNWQSVDGLIWRAVKELGVKLVAIDHLHYFTRELNNVAEDLGRITKEFKKNAIRHNIPIILISHTRKGDGKDINALRGSSFIAQDADIVLMVGRDKDDPGLISVLCEKNRNRGYDYEENEVFLNFENTKITERGMSWNTSVK